MLTKRQRLTRRQFAEYFASGRRIHGPYFTLIFTPHTSFHGSVVIGKKVAKRAVVRNQLRRRVYGALYRLQQAESLSGVYILIAKSTLKSLPRKQVAAEVADLVGRTGK